MTDQECIFCKIASGDSPAQKVYQDEWVTAFRVIHPLAPVHVLIIPNRHLASVNDLQPEHAPTAARMLTIVSELARQEGIAESGYRLIMNTGPDANQMVWHMHMHVLGGSPMQHPMG